MNKARSQHVVKFADSTTPAQRAKPAGMIGAKICVKVDGPPPVDPGDLPFLAVDTRAPYTRYFDIVQSSEPPHCMLRWGNSRGSAGPWSEAATGMIGA